MVTTTVTAAVKGDTALTAIGTVRRATATTDPVILDRPAKARTTAAATKRAVIMAADAPTSAGSATRRSA